jgi:hypothetical protein
VSRARRQLSDACANCGRKVPPGELDAAGWCKACRAEVVHRASLYARGAALFVSLMVAAWIAVVVGPSSRFLVGWMALVAATYLVTARLVRRIAFEIIRNRGVAPPKR